MLETDFIQIKLRESVKDIKGESTRFVYILSCDHILTNLMLSRIVSAFDSFYDSRRITFVSKILATIVNGRYILATGVSKFFALLFCTASAPVYPQN